MQYTFKVLISDNTGDDEFPSFKKIPDNVQTTCYCPQCRHPHYVEKENALKEIICRNCGLSFQFIIPEGK